MSWTAWAHPRSRGENSLSSVNVMDGVGSSPLTRGKHRGDGPADADRGLIPAHAGKTTKNWYQVFRWEAHPRSRGENTADDALTAQPAGSSPLTRGKQRRDLVDLDRQGLIPAHAGKTRGTGRYRPAPAAHPRSRGENTSRSGAGFPCCGSSPLTRGKRFELQESREDTGLIPAHAGKTGFARLGGGRMGAHPRSRGENGHGDTIDPN